MFPVDIVKFLRTAFLEKTSVGCFWQSYHSTVKSARVFLIWFHAFTCLRTWLKSYAKRSTKVLYYHVTKQFLSCLNWFITCFRFQDILWRNISCFRFWWKIYTKRCTNNNVVPRVKRLSSPPLCAWSIWGHDLEMEECRIGKNIELKIWR